MSAGTLALPHGPPNHVASMWSGPGRATGLRRRTGGCTHHRRRRAGDWGSVEGISRVCVCARARARLAHQPTQAVMHNNTDRRPVLCSMTAAPHPHGVVVDPLWHAWLGAGQCVKPTSTHGPNATPAHDGRTVVRCCAQWRERRRWSKTAAHNCARRRPWSVRRSLAMRRAARAHTMPMLELCRHAARVCVRRLAVIVVQLATVLVAPARASAARALGAITCAQSDAYMQRHG